MQLNDYQQLALRTAGDHGEFDSRIMYSALGLSGEVGEVADIIKKAFFHGHKLDTEDMKAELGDILWYLSVMADTLGFTLEEVAQYNIDKLIRRYPDGFSKERSINRID